jgi:hypothetical protein
MPQILVKHFFVAVLTYEEVERKNLEWNHQGRYMVSPEASYQL